MNAGRTTYIRTNAWSARLLLTLALVICVELWVFSQRNTLVFSSPRAAWMNALSPEWKGALALLACAGSALFVLWLTPLVVLRRPAATVDVVGVQVWGVGRRRMRWDEIGAVLFKEHVIRFIPKPSDPDQRPMQVVFAKAVNHEDLIEAIHPHRDDLVPVPRSILRQREEEARQERAKVERARGPTPAVIYDPRAWTG